MINEPGEPNSTPNTAIYWQTMYVLLKAENDKSTKTLIEKLEAAKNEAHPLDSDFDMCISIVKQHGKEGV